MKNSNTTNPNQQHAVRANRSTSVLVLLPDMATIEQPRKNGKRGRAGRNQTGQLEKKCFATFTPLENYFSFSVQATLTGQF